MYYIILPLNLPYYWRIFNITISRLKKLEVIFPFLEFTTQLGHRHYKISMFFITHEKCCERNLRKIRENLCDLGVAKNLLNMTQKAQIIKE